MITFEHMNKKTKDRGFWLSSLIQLGALSEVIGIIYNIFALLGKTTQYIPTSQLELSFFIIRDSIILYALYLSWKWKKLGVYIWAGLAPISWLITVTSGKPMSEIFSSIIVTCVILFLLIKPRWKDFS